MLSTSTQKTISNGCTEAEALSVAEMVDRLLERYSLTMEQVNLRGTACIQLELYAGGQRRRPVDRCVIAIARFCDCKVWLTRLETDAMLCRYLFEVVVTVLRTYLAGFKARNPRLRDIGLRRAGESFQHGIFARIATRLTADHTAREAAFSTQRASCTALMLIKHSMVEKAFAATQTRLVWTRRATRTIVRSAYQDGLQAGDKSKPEPSAARPG